MSGFSELLDNVRVGEAKEPKPIPEGSYIAVIKETKFDESSQQKTPYLRVFFEIISVCDDVDQAEIEALGGEAELMGKRLRQDFYITDDALFILQNFITKHVKLDVDGSFSEAIPLLPDNEVGIRVAHTIDKDNPEKVYTNIKGTFDPDTV